MAGTRRKGRAIALQMLYQAELNNAPPESLARFWEEMPSSKAAMAFASELAAAARAHQPEIDLAVEEVLENWKLSRLSVVVRNLLRLAVCEMRVLKDTPPQVIINEAVELTREFMDEESVKFVNSVLEKCWHAMPGSSTEPYSGNLTP